MQEPPERNLADHFYCSVGTALRSFSPMGRRWDEGAPAVTICFVKAERILALSKNTTKIVTPSPPLSSLRGEGIRSHQPRCHRSKTPLLPRPLRCRLTSRSA